MAWNSVSLKNLPQSDRNHVSEEVKLGKNLSHPNIVHFISAWTNGAKDELVLITEIVTGGSLRQYLKKIKYPRLKVIKLWCRGILLGLNYLHTQTPHPIIHRDLKCANIFIMSNTGDVKIGDFGLSTFMKGSMKTSVLGTPEYMAPEVYKGYYDIKVDIYSFGMCIIEMCTLNPPYSECCSQASIYKKVMSCEPPAGLLQIQDQEVVNFIKKCTLPSELRPSAEELLNDDFLIINEDDKRIHSPPALNSLPVLQTPNEKNLDVNATSNKNAFNLSLSILDISLIINNNGEVRQISFPFNIETDTPEKVAVEMVDDLKLNKNYIIPIAKEIEFKIKCSNLEQLMDYNIDSLQIPLKHQYNRYRSPSDHKTYHNLPEFKEEDSSTIFEIDKNIYFKTVRSENDLESLNNPTFTTLKKGLDNNRASVKKLQIALSAALGTPLKINGFFGKKVEAQVKVFQESQGIKPDGVVGKEVWENLLIYSQKKNDLNKYL